MGSKHRARVVRTAALALGLAAIAIFTVMPSAAAKAPKPAAGPAVVAADLSSMPKIDAYIRSLGVDPKDVVVQRGARNYAGPDCPGAGWNCTTSTKVVQFSATTTNGGDDDHENRFVCRRDKGSGTVTPDSTPPDQTCLIVQPAGSSNSATCSMQTFGSTGSISQTCFITQGGASNTANATLVAGMASGGGDQTVNQRIEIKQTNGSAGNTLNASETAGLGMAKKASGADVIASQNFHQVICGNQAATGSGSNTATVKQLGAAGAAFSNAGAVSVDQNTDFVTSTCTDGSGGTGGAAPFADIANSGNDPLACPLPGGSSVYPKASANSCSRIQQLSVSGKNRVTKQEQSNLLAAAVDGAVDANIDQGTFDNGIESTQDQVSSGGVSSIVDTQGANQIASLKNVSGFVNASQTEDPRCCAGGHQIGGGTADSWSLGQDVNQRVYVDGQLVDPNTFTPNVFIRQDGADRGFCTTDGNCTVNQHASNNVQNESNSASGTNVDISTTTFAGGGD